MAKHNNKGLTAAEILAKLLSQGGGNINDTTTDPNITTLENGRTTGDVMTRIFLQDRQERLDKKLKDLTDPGVTDPGVTDPGTPPPFTYSADPEILALEKKLLALNFGISEERRPPTDDERFEIARLETEISQRKLRQEQQQQIGRFTTGFESSAATRRQSLVDMLAQSDTGITEQFGKDLLTQGQETFKQANPYILEDLNRRGLFTSPSEVANAQSRALQALATQNQGELSELTANLGMDTRNRLAGLDESIFNQLNELKTGGLNLGLGVGQNILDEAFSLKRSQLNRAFDVADADREERMAKYIARRNRRASLTNSLITAGGAIIGSFAGPGGTAVGARLGSELGKTMEAPSAIGPAPLELVEKQRQKKAQQRQAMPSLTREQELQAQEEWQKAQSWQKRRKGLKNEIYSLTPNF